MAFARDIPSTFSTRPILLTGDFNAEIYDHYLESFLYQHELRSLVKGNAQFVEKATFEPLIDFK